MKKITNHQHIIWHANGLWCTIVILVILRSTTWEMIALLTMMVAPKKGWCTYTNIMTINWLRSVSVRRLGLWIMYLYLDHKIVVAGQWLGFITQNLIWTVKKISWYDLHRTNLILSHVWHGYALQLVHDIVYRLVTWW